MVRNMRLNLYDKTNKQKTDLYRAVFSQNMPKQYFTNQEFPQSENGAYRHMTHHGRSTAESEPPMTRKLGVSAWWFTNYWTTLLHFSKKGLPKNWQKNILQTDLPKTVRNPVAKGAMNRWRWREFKNGCKVKKQPEKDPSISLQLA